jgi:hypothetical protein
LREFRELGELSENGNSNSNGNKKLVSSRQLAGKQNNNGNKKQSRQEAVSRRQNKKSSVLTPVRTAFSNSSWQENKITMAIAVAMKGQ